MQTWEFSQLPLELCKRRKSPLWLKCSNCSSVCNSWSTCTVAVLAVVGVVPVVRVIGVVSVRVVAEARVVAAAAVVRVVAVVGEVAVVRVVAGEDGILLLFTLYSEKKAKQCPLFNTGKNNRPFSNSRGWTGSSTKWRLMRANLFKCKLICPH